MKINNNFGSLVKYVRKNRKLTMKQLAELSGISERQILRIEQSEVVEGTLSTMYALSKVLNINLIEYYTIFTKFNSLEEYETYTEIRFLIETTEYEKLETMLQNFQLEELTKRKFSILTQVIYYAHALITCVKYKNLHKSLELCYLALDTDKDSFSINNLKKYLTNDISYAILSQMEVNFFRNGCHQDAFKISNKIISLIEENYYDSNLPVVSVSTIVFRTYIVLLNNQADSLFCATDYESSILLCVKAIQKLDSTNSNYVRHCLFFLLAENYYMLNEITKANEYFNKSIAACISTNNLDYIHTEIEPKLKTIYPLLALPNIL